MRGAWSISLVLALGAAITMWQMSGAAAALGLAGTGDDLQTDDALQEQSENLNPNRDGLTGSASQQEGSIVGLIVGGGQTIFTFLGAVVLLPAELNNLGAPWWLAYPAGLILQAHAGIAGIQFGINRVLR
jgi:hypothetical protein